MVPQTCLNDCPPSLTTVTRPTRTRTYQRNASSTRCRRQHKSLPPGSPLRLRNTSLFAGRRNLILCRNLSRSAESISPLLRRASTRASYPSLRTPNRPLPGLDCLCLTKKTGTSASAVRLRDRIAHLLVQLKHRILLLPAASCIQELCSKPLAFPSILTALSSIPLRKLSANLIPSHLTRSKSPQVCPT